MKTIVVDNREPVLKTELQGLKQQACRTEEDRGHPSVLALAGEEKGVRPHWLAGVGGSGSRRKEVDRPQPGAGSRTHSEPDGAVS